MSKASTNDPCIYGSECVFEVAAHPPPVKWIEKLRIMVDQAIGKGLLSREEAEAMALDGLYLLPEDSTEHKILKDDPKVGVQIVPAS